VSSTSATYLADARRTFRTDKALGASTTANASPRSATHRAHHVGQIVVLARHCAGPAWTSLSIPKGRSAEFARGTFKQGIVPRR